jgi:probable rRNA maturation factor
MSITIQLDDTITHTIDQALLERAIHKTLDFSDRLEVEVTLQLTDDKSMRQLNRDYRGIDKTTDVLAFNQEYVDPETGRFYLGDIIISTEQAQRQAVEHHQTLNEECALLAVHGTLHLLGYDHAEAKEKDKMWKIQEKILHSLQIAFREDAE